jgi:hypothetical protein
MDTIQLTKQEIQDVYLGLLALDGYDRVMDKVENEPQKTIKQPYYFEDKVRWNIARNIGILKHFIAISEPDLFIKELDDSNAEMIGIKLLRLKPDELNVKANPIPPSVLDSLSPILIEESVRL